MARVSRFLVGVFCGVVIGLTFHIAHLMSGHFEVRAMAGDKVLIRLDTWTGRACYWTVDSEGPWTPIKEPDVAAQPK